MKTKCFLLLVTMLQCINAFAQNGNTGILKGDVNEDDAVDVADIVAVIDIMANEAEASTNYFYLGTTKPTAENYKKLSKEISSFTSINDVWGTTASITSGETLYMLCPVSWMNGTNVIIEDTKGNTIYFSEHFDVDTVLGHVIYKTQVWDNADMVTLKTKKSADNQIIKVSKSADKNISSHSLLEGILMATQGFDNTIIVEDGTYDLIEEFENYYGATFFTNYDNTIKGIYLKNRVKVIFSDGANVVCHYSGNNEIVQREFSPFNSAEYGFTLDNLHLRCSRVRYCIHDERGSTTDSYENVYQNCDLQIDNTNNAVWHSSQTIGGGLGKHGYIKVLNCVLETIDSNMPSNCGTISWHNSVQSGAQSTLIISGNHLKGAHGQFRLSWYGTSNLITKAFIINNRMSGSVIHRQEKPSYDVHNTEVVEWNNSVWDDTDMVHLNTATNVGLLKSDGSVDESQTDYKYSDYIEIPESVNGIYCYNVFPYQKQKWSGLCVYDSDKNFLGNGENIDLCGTSRPYENGLTYLSNFSNAKYVRFSPAQDKESDCCLEWVNVTVYQTISGITTSHVGLLKNDGTVDTSQTNYKYSDYIEIPDGTSVINAVRVFPNAGSWTGLQIFGNNKNFLGVGENLQNVNSIAKGETILNHFKGAKYVRFAVFDERFNNTPNYLTFMNYTILR